MGMVYVATNKHNGKKYVGYTTVTVDARRNDHLKLVVAGSQTAFHRALRKYGGDAFTWEIVFTSLLIEELQDEEIFFIKQLNTKSPHGYNLTDGGEGLVGCTEETRRKIGLAHKGRKRPPRTPEYRKKMSEANRRRLDGESGPAIREEMRKRRLAAFAGPKGEELRRKIGNGNRGKPMSEEQKAKLRESRRLFLESEAGAALRERYSNEYRGRKLSEETCQKMSNSRTKKRDVV